MLVISNFPWQTFNLLFSTLAESFNTYVSLTMHKVVPKPGLNGVLLKLPTENYS